MLDAYRLMGLDLDASYDEIETAYADLLDIYSKDAKRKIHPTWKSIPLHRISPFREMTTSQLGRIYKPPC